MKSVFKTVAPIAMTITFALSGAAMADTAAAAAKSADSAKTAESVKPPVQHHHKSKQKKLEQAEAKVTATPVAAEKTATAKPAVTDKVAAAESSKSVEPVKTK